VPEALADGIVGRLAKTVDPAALAEAIRELYSSRRLRTDLGWWGRCHVESEFSFEASSRTLFFAMREAMRLAGADLVPKLKLDPKPKPLPEVSVLLEELGFIRSSTSQRVGDRRFQLGMLDYYQSQIAHYRSRPTPWWLKPKAWLARINRNSIRKAIAREDKKRRKPDAK
jgi:hypothetical protein